MTPTIEFDELPRPDGYPRAWVVVVMHNGMEWAYTFDAEQDNQPKLMKLIPKAA